MDEEWWRGIAEDLSAKFGEPAPVVGRERVVPAGPPLVVTKLGCTVPVSDELAMEYGLIPDARPPVRYSRRVRLRWWRQWKVDGLRMRVGSWVAGVDLSERDEY